MLTNAEINPPLPDGTELLPSAPSQSPDPDSLSPSYRDRLNRWAIARQDENDTQAIVSRFRSHSDAEGHLKFLRQRFPDEKFVIIVEQ